MFCKNCGAEIAEGKKFCPNCGAQIGVVNQQNTEVKSEIKKETKRMNILPILVVGVVVVIAVVAFLVLNKGENNNENIMAETPALEETAPTTNVANPINENAVISEEKGLIRNAKPVDVNEKNVLVDNYETVTFGKYEQNNMPDGLENIEWIVLEKNQEYACLLSKYIIDCIPYHDAKSNITWENSYIRNWLNTAFYEQAFSQDEKNMIITVPIANSDNMIAYTKGGNQTEDKVYELSIDECDKYFGGYNYQGQLPSIATRGTEFAKSKGLYVDNEQGQWFAGNSTFWLRSPGATQDRASTVLYTGNYRQNGSSVNVGLNGVRPVIWVKYN